MLIIKEAHASWLSYHLLLFSLVGIDIVRTPPLTLDKEVRMQEEWHRDERKCALVILAHDLLLLDLDIVKDDRPSIAVASPSRIPLP